MNNVDKLNNTTTVSVPLSTVNLILNSEVYPVESISLSVRARREEPIEDFLQNLRNEFFNSFTQTTEIGEHGVDVDCQFIEGPEVVFEFFEEKIRQIYYDMQELQELPLTHQEEIRNILNLLSYPASRDWVRGALYRLSAWFENRRDQQRNG